jgi:hypothetical protein
LSKAILKESKRAEALRSKLTEEALGLGDMRFEPSTEWLDVPPVGVTFEAGRNSCSVAIGVVEGKNESPILRVSRKGLDPIEHRGGIVWCSCDKESVSLAVVDHKGKRVALRWLTATMGAIGGIEVLTGKEIEGFFVMADPRAYGCADAAFSMWAQTAGNASLSPFDERMKEVLEPLKEEQFAAQGILESNQRFGVVPSRKDHCYLVLPFGEKAPVTLRNADGNRLIEDTQAAMGWCTYQRDRVHSVWRKDPGPPRMLVLEAPAKRMGGLTGLRESAARHGAKEIVCTLEAEDLAADAVAALIRSGIAETTIVKGQTTGLPGNPNAQAVAFGFYSDSSFLPDVAPPVPVACEPKMVPGAPFQTVVCVQAWPQRWRREGSVESQGAAEGRLPFWLSVLANTKNEKAVQAMAHMLKFSRRMTLLGFEPTTTDGVRVSAMGGEVSGRPNKTEAIAVGLSNQPPWIHPLTHGPTWKLDGDLPIFKIKSEQVVRVRPVVGGMSGAIADRRVVVWRR